MSKTGSQVAMSLLLFTGFACGESGDSRTAPGPAAQAADETQDQGGVHAEQTEAHGASPNPQSTTEAASLGEAWAALRAARDAIAADIASGALDKLHQEAERLPELAQGVLEFSTELAPDKRARVEGAVKQMPRLAEALDEMGDKGDAVRSAEQLAQLDALLELIAVQYPAGALESSGSGAPHAGGGHDRAMHDHSAMSALPGHEHKTRPLAAVDAPAQATIVVVASEFAFEPSTIELRAGVPTRIELDNRGAAVEHSLLVHAPNGGDWIHLHAAANGTDAGTFQIDTPGSYDVLCTIPGHTEAGMVGKLVIAAT